MRISFDLDDTLVCGAHVPEDPPLGMWRRFWYPEPLRRGTRSLMEELRRQGCEVWVYTTSYRSARYVRGWFRCHGVVLDGVVNQDRHLQVVGRHGPSKYPPAFGINLHVDDSAGVALEGKRLGFEVVVVSLHDQDWVACVLEAAMMKTRGM